MRGPTITILAAAASLVVGVALGLLIGHRDNAAKTRAIASREVVNAELMALSHLRTKDRELTLLGMEGTLDRALLVLWDNRAAFSASERRAVTDLIRRTAKYRHLFPRKHGATGTAEDIEVRTDSILAAVGSESGAERRATPQE